MVSAGKPAGCTDSYGKLGLDKHRGTTFATERELRQVLGSALTLISPLAPVRERPEYARKGPQLMQSQVSGFGGSEG